MDVTTSVRSLDSVAAMHVGDDCGARPVFIAAGSPVAHRQRRVETAGSGTPQGSRVGSIPAVASLTSEWYWREDVQFAAKPWRVVQKWDGRELQGRNVKRESDARALAESWATNPQRTGRLT